jgi:SAM-dependent methyltransferase
MPAEQRTPAAYGDACAEFYDQIYGQVPRAVVASLLTLVGAGRSLELGSATGRVALALRAAGHHRYVGVEVSERMIDAMRAKPESRDMQIVQGDFAECALPGAFDLIFALVSTFQLLPSLHRQASAFKNLAAYLAPGGILLLECCAPTLLDNGGPLLHTTYRVHTRNGERDYPISAFLSSPTELDTMALAAGLSLAARWSDWRQQAYAGGAQHISLYRSACATRILA